MDVLPFEEEVVEVGDDADESDGDGEEGGDIQNFSAIGIGTRQDEEWNIL